MYKYNKVFLVGILLTLIFSFANLQAQGVGFDVRGGVPHIFEQFASGNNSQRIGCQITEKHPLERGYPDLTGRGFCFEKRKIYFDIAKSE